MRSTPSTSDDEPIEGVVVDSSEGPQPVVLGFDGASDDFTVFTVNPWNGVFHHWNSAVWDYLSRPARASTHYFVDESGTYDTREAAGYARSTGRGWAFTKNPCPVKPHPIDWLGVQGLKIDAHS